jgi:hypothetical protein
LLRRVKPINALLSSQVVGVDNFIQWTVTAK